MTFDPQVPAVLKESQEWFAGIITQPIDLQSRINPMTPSGNAIEQEACHYIAPSPTLRPHQRIELYNQQYWWRLLNVLHEIFPLVTRLFGYTDFNAAIGFPYLQAYPPRTWALSFIGDDLPLWIEKKYQANDKNLVLDAARLDLAFNNSFLTAHYQAISEEETGLGIDALLSKKLYLQPHVQLFALDCDLFSFRKEFLSKDPNYWIVNDFPVMARDRRYYHVLSRNMQNLIVWREIPEEEYAFLKQFSNGSTIEDACDWLDTQPEKLKTAAEQYLAKWLQEWTVRRWLTTVNKSYECA